LAVTQFRLPSDRWSAGWQVTYQDRMPANAHPSLY